MTDPAASFSVIAALLAGVVGSTHCFGMCGGVAGALGMRARMTSTTPAGALLQTTLYQLGRIGGYSLAGGLSGALGQSLRLVLDLGRAGALLRVASGLLLILIAMRMLIRWNALAILERLGARLWRRIQPLMRSSAATTQWRQALTLGLLWAWLPCGLVYSMLLVAAVTGDALRGAAVMAAFGMGTLPAMMASSWFAGQLQKFCSGVYTRTVSGVLLCAMGVWTAVAGLQHFGHALHVH